MTVQLRSLFALTVILTAIAGCDVPLTTRPENMKPASTQQFISPDSKVMTEEYRRAVTDQVVKQGSDRTEAEAFTKTLNDAQREWENKR